MLTEGQISRVGNFDQSTIDNLRVALNGGIEAISAAGALSLASYETQLTVSGTVAYTLAAPTVAGQKKRIVCVSAASSPAGTLTISSPDDTTGFVCPSAFTFNTVGQAVELVATAALKWRASRVQRAGAQAVVIGTTTLTNLNLAAVYVLSVTGTVSSSGVRALPNGAAYGETIGITVGTAASIPNGSLSFVGTSGVGVAATAMTALDNTADAAVLMWTGSTSGWQAISTTGITYT